MLIKDFLYPTYDCHDCIGMPEYGCYCDIQGAVAPGVGPSRLVKALRRVWSHVAIDFGRDMYRREGRTFRISLFRRPAAIEGTLVYRFNAELHWSWRRGFTPWFMLCPAWADVPSVKAEYELTMRPRPYRDAETSWLWSMDAHYRWNINETYGSLRRPKVDEARDFTATYSHIAAIRRELKLRAGDVTVST